MIRQVTAPYRRPRPTAVLAAVTVVALVGAAAWFAMSYRTQHRRALAIQDAVLATAERYVTAYGGYDPADEPAWRGRLRAAGASAALAAEVVPPEGPAGLDARPEPVSMRCDQLQYPAACDVTLGIHLGGRPMLARVNLRAPRDGTVEVHGGPRLVLVTSSRRVNGSRRAVARAPTAPR